MSQVPSQGFFYVSLLLEDACQIVPRLLCKQAARWVACLCAQASGLRLSLVVPEGGGQPSACLCWVCLGPTTCWGEARCLVESGSGDRVEAMGASRWAFPGKKPGFGPALGAAGASLCCLGFQSPQLVSEDNKTEAFPPWATPPWPQMGCG